MKRTDRIKLDFTRNWKLPGKERFSHWLKPSGKNKLDIKDGIAWLSNEDIAIYVNSDSYIEWTVLSTGTYEDEMNRLIRISLKEGNNALDIGGNIGLQSIRMSQCVGNTGHVYAFEPLNYLQKKLNRNVSLNNASNISVFPFALSDEEGEADFTINEQSWNQGTFSLFSKSDGAQKQHIIIKVADDMSEIQNLQSLGLVKIDVEGFEYQVMLGLRKTLTKHRPRIIFEYDTNYWPAGKIGDCYNFLKSLNYTLYQITPVCCELIVDAGNILGGNLFCIPG